MSQEICFSKVVITFPQTAPPITDWIRSEIAHQINKDSQTKVRVVISADRVVISADEE